MTDNRRRLVRVAGWALPGLTMLELAVALMLAGLNVGRIGADKTGAPQLWAPQSWFMPASAA